LIRSGAVRTNTDHYVEQVHRTGTTEMLDDRMERCDILDVETVGQNVGPGARVSIDTLMSWKWGVSDML
jgi:hypothetical protein